MEKDVSIVMRLAGGALMCCGYGCRMTQSCHIGRLSHLGSLALMIGAFLFTVGFRIGFPHWFE